MTFLQDGVTWLVNNSQTAAGESITVTDGTKTITPTAVVTEEVLQRRRDDTGLVIAYAREAQISGTDEALLNGSKAVIGMTALIGGREYDVENIVDNGNAVTLKLVRYQIRSRTGPNYNRR